VEVTGKDGKKQTLTAKHIIVATGSRPRDLPFLKIDHERVWDSTDAMMAKEAPETLAVVGAGAIGCEFADVYAAFGTKVTIIEALDRILPLEDKRLLRGGREELPQARDGGLHRRASGEGGDRQGRA
jgi:dihydrolipoamide dehydrogenase